MAILETMFFIVLVLMAAALGVYLIILPVAAVILAIFIYVKKVRKG